MCIRDRFSSVAISSDKVGVKMVANKTNKTGEEKLVELRKVDCRIGTGC